MAEIASGSDEQLRGRRIMHVHVVAIREEEFRQPQRVLGPRLLTDKELSGSKLVENFAADRPGGKDILPVVHNLEVVFGQIAWVAKDVRNNLPLRDGVWHLPIRTENDVLHGVAKHRGAVTVGL